MRRIVLAFAFIVLARIAGQAQPQAYDAKIDYQKGQQSVAAIDLPYSEDITEAAIKDYMSKKGLKGSSLRGFTVYRGAKLDESAGDPKDLHFKIEKKPHAKGTSVIYLLVANPNEDPATRAPGDVPLDPARTFLNNLVPSVEAANLEAQIKTQEEIVKKAQKKKNNLADDQTSLEKKIRNLQTDLDQNKKDQVTAAAAVQANVNGDAEALKKAQKKMNKLLDDQGSMQKKLRNNQSDLDQNKKDQDTQQTELDKQQQLLDSLKGRRK
ncbi:MAG: hypothetical protein P4L51_26250 [Puia sp.]|nr:hypothetical protein [Puia sp.]